MTDVAGRATLLVELVRLIVLIGIETEIETETENGTATATVAMTVTVTKDMIEVRTRKGRGNVTRIDETNDGTIDVLTTAGKTWTNDKRAKRSPAVIT